MAVDDDGVASISASIRHRQHYPRPGWVEHDPLELLRNLETVLDSAKNTRAVGIDNQGESCLAWHAVTKEPVSPVIVWQDNRTGDVIERLDRDGAGEEIMHRAGLPLDSYFSASKLAWIMNHIPEAARLRTQGKLRLGTTDAYFLDRLAGEFRTDINNCLPHLVDASRYGPMGRNAMPDLRRSHGCSARNRSHHRKSRAGDEPGSSCSDNCQRGGPASIALRPWLPAGWRCQDHFRHRRIRADGDWTRNFPVTGAGAFAHRCVAT